MEQRLEMVGIVRGERVRCEVRDDALHRFSIAFDRRRFTKSHASASAQAHDRGASDQLFAARNCKRMMERELDRRYGDGEHGARFQPHRAASPARSAPLDCRWYGRGARLRIARSVRQVPNRLI